MSYFLKSFDSNIIEELEIPIKTKHVTPTPHTSPTFSSKKKKAESSLFSQKLVISLKYIITNNSAKQNV